METNMVQCWAPCSCKQDFATRPITGANRYIDTLKLYLGVARLIGLRR